MRALLSFAKKAFIAGSILCCNWMAGAPAGTFAAEKTFEYRNVAPSGETLKKEIDADLQKEYANVPSLRIVQEQGAFVFHGSVKLLSSGDAKLYVRLEKEGKHLGSRTLKANWDTDEHQKKAIIRVQAAVKNILRIPQRLEDRIGLLKASIPSYIPTVLIWTGYFAGGLIAAATFYFEYFHTPQAPSPPSTIKVVGAK